MKKSSLHQRFAVLAACIALGLATLRKKTMSRLIVAALLLTSFTAQAQTAQPALSFQESERIWRADFERRREEKLQADERSLRDVLEKINQISETNDFSTQNIEKLFGLKLEHSQTIESPDLTQYKVQEIYIVKSADYPFTTKCPQLGLLDIEFNSKYWLRITSFHNTNRRSYSLALYYSDDIWLDLGDRFIPAVQSVIRQPNWKTFNFGPHDALQKSWRRETSTHYYSFAFLRASSKCRALRIQFSEKP
jgi:hypothetical protein